MKADDPRHGTYAGYEAHKRAGVPKCEPCSTAAYRARKRMRMSPSPWTTLGEDAYAIICSAPPSALSRSTGLHRRTLHRLKVDGPDARVRHATLATILSACPVTPIGVTRRLRALAALGWSAREVARRAGLTRWNVEYARMSNDRKYAHAEFAANIVAVYDDLSMTPAPPSRAATRQRRLAAEHGWAAPMAWDNIDFDDEPTGVLIGESVRADGLERISELQNFADGGVSADEAARRFGIAVGSLETFCARHDRNDLFMRMRSRDHNADAARGGHGLYSEITMRRNAREKAAA